MLIVNFTTSRFVVSAISYSKVMVHCRHDELVYSLGARRHRLRPDIVT